jgi:ubiquinone/menaquinone biosynthesis C-methylase UbiE
MDERQTRERDFHRAFALEHRELAERPVDLRVVVSKSRQPWNAYWSAYDVLIREGLSGKRVLVAGCGFGDDAVCIAALGAEVYASDLSPDVLAIARKRAELTGYHSISFEEMPAERLAYRDDFFDLIFFNDILHHVDIPAAVAEARRVLKPRGVIVANELYTHSAMQRIRDSALVRDVVYPRMRRFIYGKDRPYITADEHKIDESELAVVTSMLAPDYSIAYFLLIGGRLVPSHWRFAEVFDQTFFRLAGRSGGRFAGRIVLRGVAAKS